MMSHHGNAISSLRYDVKTVIFTALTTTAAVTLKWQVFFFFFTNVHEVHSSNYNTMIDCMIC